MANTHGYDTEDDIPQTNDEVQRLANRKKVARLHGGGDVDFKSDHETTIRLSKPIRLRRAA